ncbi:MAG: transcription elongation factor GreB [Xanthomonadales bacterium]|nr:transcription elongation factor GreB [Xanthomonadales bacterium]
MGRWRPPAPRSSPYITSDGARALRAELQSLWREKRPEVVKALAAAAAEGDRSENAEYSYRKKQLGEIDRRVRYLSKRLDEVVIVETPGKEHDAVRFGAWVQLQQADGVERYYRIVGADETDARQGWISVDSPLARGLLGKEAGEQIQVQLPEGEQTFTVLAFAHLKRLGAPPSS